MAHDVFISHSVKDKPVADAMCAMLESEGVRCWIAPRDVTPGMEWGKCIVDAIRHARIMVLVFTAHANASQQIRREVERAVHHDVIIVPFRVENIVPDESLEYFIGNVHWLDALTPPLEGHLKNLSGTIKMLLGRLQPREMPTEPQPAQPTKAMWEATPVPEPPVIKPAPTEFGTIPPPRLPLPSPSLSSGVRVPGAEPTRDGPATFPAIGGVAGPEPSENSGTQRFGEGFSASGTATRARALGVPLWAWGGAVALVLLMVAVFALHSGLNPSTAGAPPATAPPMGGTGSGMPAGQGGSPAVEPPSPAGTKPIQATSRPQAPPAEVGGGSQKPSAASTGSPGAAPKTPQTPPAEGGGGSPQPSQNPTGSPGAAQATPRELAAEAHELIAQKRYSEAASLAERACDGGSMEGCSQLGDLYAFGDGIAQDYAQAASLYRKACDGGGAEGCYSLGWLYDQGHGVTQDSAQAHSLFNRACDGGNMDGCYGLGTDYEFGTGVAHDQARALSLFQKACDGGSRIACARLKLLQK